MEKTRKCPYCGEEIMADAKKCKHCGEWLNDEVIPERKPQQENDERKPETPTGNDVESSSQPIVVTPATEIVSEKPKESLFKSCFWEQMTKHYCDFKGNVDRKTFWICYLYWVLLMWVIGGISVFLPLVGNVLMWIVSLGLTLPFLGLMVRRLHDIGKKGTWILISLVPLVGPIWFLVLMAQKGEAQNPNKWNVKDTIITIAMLAVSVGLFAVGIFATDSGLNDERKSPFKKEKNSETAEIEKQVLDAYNNGTIYELMTPEFKAADQKMEDATPEGYLPCVEWDFYGGPYDEFYGAKIEKVELVEDNKAHLYVTLENDYEGYHHVEKLILFMVCDSKKGKTNDSKWLVDDIRISDGEYSVRAMMVECANNDDWGDETSDENDDSGFSYEVDEYGNEYMIGEDGIGYYRGNVNDDEEGVDEDENGINVENEVVVIDATELRLRLGPSTSSETLKWGDGSNRHPEVGEKFNYLGGSGDFYKIDYKGNEVWVSKQFTHIESGNPGNNTQMTETKAVEEIVTTQTEEEIEEEIFSIVEEMPSYPGGDMKMYEYLGKNMKYPQIARESGIQGRVFVNFVVEPDGSVSNVKVLRGIGGGCDEEAVRVVKSMPKWKPGKQRGKAVRVSYTLPVVFKL